MTGPSPDPVPVIFGCRGRARRDAASLLDAAASRFPRVANLIELLTVHRTVSHQCEVDMPIRKGDRVRHRDGHVGTSVTDEAGGTIQVKQDDGAVSTWAAGDAKVIPGG